MPKPHAKPTPATVPTPAATVPQDAVSSGSGPALADLPWPMTQSEVAETWGVSKQYASYRINELIESGELQKVADGRYGLANVAYSRADLDYTLPRVQSELSDLPWPMTRSQFRVYYAEKMKAQESTEQDRRKGDLTRNGWFTALIKSGAITHLGERLYAPAAQPVVALPRDIHVALNPDADRRTRYGPILLGLPDVFTSAMFVEAAGIDSKHASSALSRLEKDKRIRRLERGRYAQDRVSLPGKFTVEQFAAHMGLDLAAAQQQVAGAVAAGRLSRVDASHYRGTKDQIEALRRQLRPTQPAPFDYAKLREEQAELPDLQVDWPIDVETYAQARGIGMQTARQHLKRFELMGLVRSYKEGRKYLFTLVPNAQLVMDPQATQRMTGSSGIVEWDVVDTLPEPETLVDDVVSALPPARQVAAPAPQVPEEPELDEELDEDDVVLPPSGGVRR